MPPNKPSPNAPFLFKVITHTKEKNFSYWPDFVDSLVMQKHYEIREERKRAPFTSRMREGQIEVVPTDKEERKNQNIPSVFSPEIKAVTTPPQSTTYCNPRIFKCKPFQNFSQTNVGIAFPVGEQCTYPTRILKKDINTTRRPFDADTKEGAVKKIEENNPYTTLQQLERSYVDAPSEDYNEVLARLRWDENNPGCRIMIFNDNPYARLIAQARALDIYLAVCNRSGEGNIDQVQVPRISFYENLYLDYSESQQKSDMEQSLKHPSYLYPLALAINALKNKTTLTLKEISYLIIELPKLSIYFNQAVVKPYLDKLPNQDFENITEPTEAYAWLWILRTQILLDGDQIFTTNPSALQFIIKDPNHLVRLLSYLPEEKRWNFVNGIKDNLGGILSNPHVIESILIMLPKNVHVDFINLANKSDNYIKQDLYGTEKHSEDLLVLLQANDTLSNEGNDKYNFVIYQMINNKKDFRTGDIKLPSINQQITQDLGGLNAALNWLPMHSRWNFITHPMVSLKLASLIEDMSDLLAVLAALPKEKHSDFIRLPEISSSIQHIMHSDLSSVITDEKSLLMILEKTDSQFFCEFIIKNSSALEVYQKLAQTGKHLNILEKLHFNKDSLKDPNVKLVLKLTLLTYLQTERAANPKSSGQPSPKEKELITAFNNNQLEFEQLATKYQQQKPSSISKMLTSWGAKPNEPRKDVLGVIVESSSKLKH